MATNTVKKISVSFRLNNGTDSDGNVKTVGLSLGNLTQDTTKYDDDKVLAIKALLEPCLEKSIYSTEKSVVTVLSA